jgi:putative endonuclease
MECFGYILHSLSDGRYYVGQSNRLAGRLEEHNRGRVRSTKTGIPWELKYSIRFSSRAEALAWERMVKARKSRAFIEAMIAGTLPRKKTPQRSPHRSAP